MLDKQHTGEAEVTAENIAAMKAEMAELSGPLQLKEMVLSARKAGTNPSRAQKTLLRERFNVLHAQAKERYMELESSFRGFIETLLEDDVRNLAYLQNEDQDLQKSAANTVAMIFNRKGMSSEESADFVCKLVQRYAHYAVKKRILDWRNDDQKNFAKQLAESISPDAKFMEYFNANYADTLYNPNVDPQILTRCLKDQSPQFEREWYVDTVNEAVAAASTIDLQTCRSLVVAMLTMYPSVTEDQQSGVNHCGKALMDKLPGIAEVMAMGQYLKLLKDAEDIETIGPIKTPLIERFKDLMEDPENVRKVIKEWPYLSKTLEDGSNFFANKIADLCRKNPAYVLEAIDEKPELTDELLALLPRNVQKKVVEMVLKSEVFLPGMNTMHLRAYVENCTVVVAEILHDMLNSGLGTLSDDEFEGILQFLESIIGDNASPYRPRRVRELEKIREKIEKEAEAVRKKAAAAAAKEAAAAAAKKAVKNAASQNEAQKTPYELTEDHMSPEEFFETVAKRFAALKDKDGNDIANTDAIGPDSYRRKELQESAAAIHDLELDSRDLFAAFTEEDSLMRNLGIVSVIFKKTSSYTVEFQLDTQGKSFPGVYLDDDFGATIVNLPEDMDPDEVANLENTLCIEVLRLFCKALDPEGGQDYDQHVIKQLLSIEELPEYDDPKPEPKPPKPNPDPGPEPPKLSFSEKNAKIFHDLEIFVEMVLEDKGKLPKDFSELAASLDALRRSIEINRTVPDNIVLTVEVPKLHKLNGIVPFVKFVDPKVSRELIEKFDLGPTLKSLKDAHVFELHYKNADGEMEQVMGAITAENDVVFFGIDNIFDDEDIPGILLMDVVLRTFKKAVTVPYKKQNKGLKKPKKPKKTPISELLDGNNRRFIPGIILCWPDNQAPDPDDADRADEYGKNERMKRRFEQMMCDPEKLAKSLSDNGVTVLGKHLSTLCLDTEDEKSAIYKIFPKNAFKERTRGFGLKPKVAEKVHVPLRGAPGIVGTEEAAIAAIEEALRMIKEERLLTSAPDKDPTAWFADVVENLGEDKAGEIFHFAVKYPEESGLIADPRFLKSKVIAKFKDPETRYQEFFDEVLNRCQEKDPDLTAVDIFRALMCQSTFNPKNLNIPTSSATDYILRYDRSENLSDLCSKVLFDLSGQGVPLNTEEAVLRVIADNKVRLSAAAAFAIRQHNRSSEMDIAAEIQNRFEDHEEVDLTPRSRALLVFQFLNKDDEEKYAFSYLASDARDRDSETVEGETISSVEILKNRDDVKAAIARAMEENITGVHSDFQEMKLSQRALQRLAKDGILETVEDARGRLSIKPGSIQRIMAKKVVIFTEESVGYRQHWTRPTCLDRYFDFCEEEGVADETIPAGFRRDRTTEMIQDTVWKVLG